MQNYQLRGYIVNPRSALNIRTIATRAREVLSLPDAPFELSSFLETLVDYGITFDVVGSNEMPGDFFSHSEACCIPETATIYLPEDTYEKACKNDPRTRFTIFHELGHLILGHSHKLHRGQNTEKAKPFFDSEWQADQFSAEILMPLSIIKTCNLTSPPEIQEKFGVSIQAAETRYRKLKNKMEI